MSTATFELSAVPPPPGDGAAVPVVEVLGQVDGTNATRLQRDLTALAAGSLIVDLSRTGYLDSAGFAVLDHLLAERAVAIVVSPAGVVRTALALLQMPFHDTVEHARAALRGE